MLDKNKIKKVASVIFLVIWIFVIFYFSNECGKISLDKSRSLLDSIINITNIDFLSVYIIRKIAHFCEYTILSILVFWVVKNFKVINKKTFFICISVCILYACCDEIHQLFVSGRDARVLDVFIDSGGILLGSIIYSSFYKSIKFKNQMK